jgi:hypothetical protein
MKTDVELPQHVSARLERDAAVTRLLKGGRTTRAEESGRSHPARAASSTR